MELYFLRHGLAGQHGDPKYKDDSLRPLTTEGRKKIHHAAWAMQVLGLRFDAVYSSPYVRARQTAEIVAKAYLLKKTEIHITDNLLPPALIEDLLGEIPTGNSLLFVGHEPHLSEMVSDLLGSNQSLDIDFKKGALCCLRTDGSSKRIKATLLWLLTPAQLQLIAASAH